MKGFMGIFFPEYTKWEILEVFMDRNAYFCLQVRANKKTGFKQFKTTCALDSYYAAQLKNFNLEKINKLTSGEDVPLNVIPHSLEVLKETVLKRKKEEVI